MIKVNIPSGVSDGHIYPQEVACNFLGGINLPVISADADTRLKCDKQLKYVNLFNTCATPTLLELVFLIPKSPVAKALLIPFSIVVDLIILYILVKVIIRE